MYPVSVKMCQSEVDRTLSPRGLTDSGGWDGQKCKWHKSECGVGTKNKKCEWSLEAQSQYINEEGTLKHVSGFPEDKEAEQGLEEQ